MQVVIDDLVISYELSGNGKTLLMLHGWGDSGATFKFISSALSGRYQLLIPDLPGFGASQAPKESWDLDNYSKIIASLLNKLELSPYAIIGHSNGGALAIRGLSLGVLKAEKLILIASAGIRNSQPVKRQVTKTVAKVGKVTTFWMPKSTRLKLRQKLYGTVGSDLLVMPELSETFKRTVRQDIQEDAGKINLPTLIINADKDPAIPIGDGKLLHSIIKGSKFEVIHSDTHFVHQQDAKQVAKLITDFL